MWLDWLKRVRARGLAASRAAHQYHLWYHRQGIWDTITWAGVKALESPIDL
jgi:cephalosporin hydroxylase